MSRREVNYVKMHAHVHIWFCERLGECAIKGEVLILEDPGTELCV